MNGIAKRALAVGIAVASGGAVSGHSMAAMELASPGTLEVGVVEAPDPGTFFVAKDKATGQLRGVTVDLGAELARKLGVKVAYRIFPNSGECTDATSAGAVDVAFMPVDDERRTKVAFGPAYALVESTYLVSGPSGLTDLASVDEARVRVIGIAGTTTIRAATRTLKQTVPAPVRSVDEAIAIMREGKADALALGRESLRPLLTVLPGSRIVEGGFQQTSISVAVPKSKPGSLAYVTTFLEDAKASGVVRRAFDKVGLQDEPVAPAGR